MQNRDDNIGSVKLGYPKYKEALATLEAKLYIIGAGFAGQMIAEDIKRKKIFGKIAAFLDDDKGLI